MKKIRVAINGFGRIGRGTAKLMLKEPSIQLVAINDLSDNDTLAHLFKYDSVHGKFNQEVYSDENFIQIGSNKLAATSEIDPARLPWNELDIDIVIEEAEPEQTQPETPKPKPAKANKPDKPQKKKRQLSEEHKAKLALAREKALVTRRKKAEEKKKMKEIENKTKELKKKKAQKDLEELEDEVIHDKPSKPTIVNQGPMFTKEDLENAQLDAIMKYEAIRKTRKEEKRKVQIIEQQKKDLQKKIQGYGARDANGKLVNKWNACY